MRIFEVSFGCVAPHSYTGSRSRGLPRAQLPRIHFLSSLFGDELCRARARLSSEPGTAEPPALEENCWAAVRGVDQGENHHGNTSGDVGHCVGVHMRIRHRPASRTLPRRSHPIVLHPPQGSMCCRDDDASEDSRGPPPNHGGGQRLGGGGGKPTFQGSGNTLGGGGKRCLRYHRTSSPPPRLVTTTTPPPPPPPPPPRHTTPPHHHMVIPPSPPIMALPTPGVTSSSGIDANSAAAAAAMERANR